MRCSSWVAKPNPRRAFRQQCCAPLQVPWALFGSLVVSANAGVPQAAVPGLLGRRENVNVRGRRPARERADANKCTTSRRPRSCSTPRPSTWGIEKYAALAVFEGVLTTWTSLEQLHPIASIIAFSAKAAPVSVDTSGNDSSGRIAAWLSFDSERSGRYNPVVTLC